MKKGLLNLILGVILVGMIGFVVAEASVIFEDPNNEQIFKEYMVWDLPELKDFILGGVNENFEVDKRVSIRYRSPQDNDQHSEFGLLIFNDKEESIAYLDSKIKDLGVSLEELIKEINENKVFEVQIQESNEISRHIFWISEKYYVQGWNGNDIGTIYDDELFDVLTLAYLEKYPSTYGCEGDECSPACANECSKEGQKRCDNENSQTCSNYDDDSCLEWNSGIICPHGCSNGVCDYILEEQENATIYYYIEPNESSGPLEIPEENSNLEGVDLFVCSGCEFENECYPFGYRKERKFCLDSNNQFVEQKKAASNCDNNFECKTNICINQKCVSG
ncbi:hypothetical protein CMI46_02030, partial [Candidatus Pacearchaeota archaeon]|nr:hypothetical protein [Candidatus Pacearchaeota archaeon]